MRYAFLVIGFIKWKYTTRDPDMKIVTSLKQPASALATKADLLSM